MDRETEVALARDLLAGKPEAFDRFVESFRSRIFQYSLTMCGHREDAEEVAQETLLKVFQSFDQLREPEHVRAWVFRVAKNACLMKRRRSVFAPREELSLDEPREGRLEIADWSRLPSDALLQQEMGGVLRQAIASLPDIYRSVLLLRDVEELSTDEAAQVLEVSTDVVKTRLHRARLALRQQLDGYLKSHN